MGNPSQTDKTENTGSGRNQQQGEPDGPIADDAGRFTREPAEGGRQSSDEENTEPADAPANGGARGKNVKNH